MKKIIIVLIIVLSLTFVNFVYAQFWPGVYLRLVDNSLLLMNSAWEFGNPALEISKGYFTNLNISNNVGIGTTTPASKLNIIQTAADIQACVGMIVMVLRFLVVLAKMVIFL